MTRPVLIQYPKSTDTFEVASVAVAERVHPDAKIVRYADSFEPYKKPAEKKQEEKKQEEKKAD